MNERDVRFDSMCKMKTSSHLGAIKDRIRINLVIRLRIHISEELPVTPSFISSETARVQANFKFDLVLQEMKHYTLFFLWLQTEVCYNVLGIVGFKLGVDSYLVKEGSRTKLYKSSNLIALLERNQELCC